MKKNYLLFFILVSGFTSTAQFMPAPVLERTVELNITPPSSTLLFLDTLDDYFMRASNYTLYQSSLGGYVLGPAVYNLQGNLVPISKETASHFDGVGGATLMEAWFIVGAKTIVGTADDVYVKVYDVGPDTIPTATLDSVLLNIQDMDTAQGITVVPLFGYVNDDFMVAISYGGIDDTFGLVSSNPDSGDGMGEQRARQKIGDELVLAGVPEWMPVHGLYQFDADAMIILVVDVLAGMTEFTNDLFDLRPISPNPAVDHVVLDYNLKAQETVAWYLMDSNGKLVKKSDPSLKSAGAFNESIDMQSMAAGKYYMMFKAGSKVLTQRFILAD